MARTRLTAVAVASASATAVGASIASNFATAPTPVQVTFGVVATVLTLGVVFREEDSTRALSKKSLVMHAARA